MYRMFPHPQAEVGRWGQGGPASCCSLPLALQHNDRPPPAVHSAHHINMTSARSVERTTISSVVMGDLRIDDITTRCEKIRSIFILFLFFTCSLNTHHCRYSILPTFTMPTYRNHLTTTYFWSYNPPPLLWVDFFLSFFRVACYCLHLFSRLDCSCSFLYPTHTTTLLHVPQLPTHIYALSICFTICTMLGTPQQPPFHMGITLSRVLLYPPQFLVLLSWRKKCTHAYKNLTMHWHSFLKIIMIPLGSSRKKTHTSV